MHARELQHLQWLNAMLADDRQRSLLRSLLAQYDLPVIQLGRFNRRQIRKERTAPRNFNRVKRATI